MGNTRSFIKLKNENIQEQSVAKLLETWIYLEIEIDKALSDPDYKLRRPVQQNLNILVKELLRRAADVENKNENENY